MGKFDKIILKVLSGLSDQNISFNDLRSLLSHFDFSERIKGSHHIYFHNKIDEIINIQPKGNKAKAYQVKQIRLVILKYKLNTK